MYISRVNNKNDKVERDKKEREELEKSIQIHGENSSQRKSGIQ